MGVSDPPKILYIYQIEGKLPRFFSYSHSDLLGVWQEEDETFLFFRTPSDEDVMNLTSSLNNFVLKQRFEMEFDEWHGGKLKPVIVEDITIVPAWMNNYTCQENTIFIDPSVVFGTPNHETTLNCIKLMSHVFKREKVHEVLDMGCGTGILGVIALKFGASHVISFDMNSLAVKTARKNFRLNGFEDNVFIFQARAEEYYFVAADIVMANLPFFVVNEFINKRDFWINKRWVIISGMFPSQANILKEKVNKFSFKDKVALIRVIGDGWPTFLFKVKDNELD